MAGVFDQVNSGIKENGAVAAGGGVSFVPENKGVFDSVENAQRGVFESAAKSRPADPIYDQWKLEQQLKEQMRQRRVQETAAQEAAAKAVFAQPAPVEPKTKEELRTDRKAAMETAREDLRQARAEAGEAYATAEDPVAALPVYKKALADANAAFDAAKTAAWEPANRQAAPERYDPFVQNAGQAKAEWYDPAVIAKGEQAKGNPLQEDARKKLAGGGMGNVNAAMEEMRAIDALTEDQKAYINYVYGKYDKKLAGQLTETLLQNVLNTLNAADERQKTQNVFTAVGGPVFAAPVYAAEMLGQAAENLAKGSNLPVAEYTPGSRMMSEQTARTQDLVDDAKTPVGEFLTQTGVGVGQNVLNMVLFGKAAPAVMAIQSMGSGGYEAAQNGATGWQQLGKGAQSAVTELVTEKISFGKLEDILNGVTPKTAKGIIAKIAAQMATEAGEETAGEAISILYDWIAMGDKGDLAQVMKEYREENGDDGAGGYLALQILQRLGEAAAGGAISGGVLGGGATVMNAVQSRNAEKATAQAADLTQETAEAAGDDAARMEAETAENAIKRDVEEMPAEEKEAVIAKELEALPQDLQSNAENEDEIDGILKELGYETETMPIQSAEQETGFQGRVDDSAIQNIELTERQKADRKVYEALSSALGVKIRLTASKADEMGRRSGANGYYDRRTNSFVFDINAENFSELDRDAKGQLNTAAVLTMSHELTHYIQRWNPEQYNVLKDTVMQILQERTGQDVATIINRKRQTLMQDGQPRMDDAAVLDEIVADGCQMMLRDSGLFEQIAQKNRTLGQKIVEWLRGAVNALRKAYEGLSARSSEAKYIGQVAENYQRVLDRWTEALMTARDISKGVSGAAETAKKVAEGQKYEDAKRQGKYIAEKEANKRKEIVKATKDGKTLSETVAEVDKTINKGRQRTEAEMMKDRAALAKEVETYRAFAREGGTEEEYLQNGAPEMREIRPKGWAAGKAIDAQADNSDDLEKEYQKSVLEEVGVQTDSKTESAAPEYISLSRRQPWQVDLKTGAWEATTDVPGRQAPYQKPRQTEQISQMLEEQTKPSDEEKITDLQSTASQVKQPEAESTANVQQTKTKPEELPKAEKTESNGSENPNKSGWEKFKENRIAQAMQNKPEGAVARMDAADSVRKAEEEIAKAKELLNGLKGNAEPGEIDDAESIAKGHKTLQQVSADFSKEKVALMAEQMRLIKQWEEQGLVGQKKRLHSEQFEAAEKLLEGADDAIFEHDTEGAKKLISKRKGELFRMLSSTSERVMRQVFDKKTAQRAIEEYIRPAERNEAAKIMAISRLFDGARELKLNRYESTMVQLVGEGLVPAWSKAGANPLWHNGQALVESLPEYARANPEIQKLAENLGELDAQKITKAVTWYRKTYDDFHALVNDFRLAHGMPEIGNIEQYFPHFSQDMDGDMLNQTLKAFGIEQMSSLPASIAGMTQGFRPFSRWVGSFQKRTGPQTVFDAEQGFQMYANAVMDMLYHTDDIMRIRHLETMIRRRSKEAGETGKRPGTKERMEAMKQTMENPEQLKKLEEDMELGERNGSGKDISGEYSGFVQWLREYGNKLAGKGDTYRLGEPVAGRQAANVINKLLGNYGTAQIVGNLRSAIANTAVLPKMLALLGTQKGSALKPEIYIGQALGKMARGEMANLYGKSEFMTSKQGVEPLVKTKKDKAADVMMKFFNVVEDAMSKLAFTAGYVQAEDQLKDSKLNSQELEREAIQRANDFAANIMARRDKAGSALLGRSREPLLRLVGMFQTEISNEWQTLRQDLPREYEELEQQIGKKKAIATYTAALARYVVYSHVLGFAAEAIFGINPFNDVWAWIADFARNIWEEPEEEDEKGKIDLKAVPKAATELAGEVAGSVPYLSTIAALAGYTNDRLPLFNAKEFVEDLGSIVTAERFSGRVEGIANVAGSVGQLLGVPGAGQGVKTVKGAAALLDQGKRSQKTGQLQDVWQWDGGKGAGDLARALAFGPSAMKGMREYYDSGYSAELTTAQTRAYDAAIGAGVPKDKALEYVKWSKDVKAVKDEKGNTVPHSRNVKFLAMAESIEGLTAEQQAILYQGALPSDQAEEFEKMSQTVKNMGIDTETWMEFLRRYYQINGSGKKDKVKKLMAVLSIPPVWQKDLAKVVGYEL